MPDIRVLQELYVAELKNLKASQLFKPNTDINRRETEKGILDVILHDRKHGYEEEKKTVPHLSSTASPVFRMKFEKEIADRKTQLEKELETLHSELRQDEEYIIDNKVEYLISLRKLEVIENQLMELGVRVYLVSVNRAMFITEGGILEKIEF